MTIQRQYSLPNCTLILHGLNQSIGFGVQTEVRPLISILMATECHFAGHTEVLRGGREFFESLIFAVSSYAQEFLSQVHVPLQERLRQRPSLVLIYLERIDRNLHRLIVKPQDPNDPNQANAAQVDLTTVHLFDLVEAIDQFFADPQTLPDLSLQLAPLPKRYAVSREPLLERAAPITIGASGLVLAAAALFMLPVPQVKRTEPTPKTAEPGAVQSPAASPSPGTSSTSPTPASPAAKQLQESPSPSPAVSPQASPQTSPQSVVPPGSNPISPAAVAANSPGNSPGEAAEIVDPQELKQLNQQLYNQIDTAWKTAPKFNEKLTYRVSVRKDGKIVGYKPINSVALDSVNQTPLLNLVEVPTADRPPESAPLAQFKVVFTPNGVLEVNPWHGYPTPLNAAAPITDADQLKQLNEKLYTQLDQKWKGTPDFKEDLVYRVKISNEGKLAGYEAVNQPAVNFAQKTPLPDLLKASPEFNGNQGKIAQFRVVFKGNGVLQVSPWDGDR